jgi:hypothetical protein
MFTMIVVVGFLIVPQASRLLDVTQLPERHLEGVESCASGFSGSQPQSSDLTIETIGLDRSEYALGAKAVLDVVLVNTGRKPLQFPWARPGDVPGAAPESLVSASIALATTDVDGRDLRIAGTVLQGSRDAPDSIAVLAPGGRITVRVPVFVRVTAPHVDTLTGGGRRQAAVSAVVTLSPQRCQWTIPVRSEPQQITLTKR